MFAPAPAAPATSATSTVCRLIRSGRVWICDDDLGVSRAVAYALTQDARDYLWIGTEDGPILFDGLAWAAPPSLAALGGRIIKAAAQTPDRTMWLGTDGAGLVGVDLSAVPYRVMTHLDGAAGLPSARVHSVWAAPDGDVWAGTHAGLALIRAGQVQRVVTPAEGLPAPIVWALCGDLCGRLWVGTKRGLALLHEGVVQPPSVADGQTGFTAGVHQLCCDARGQVWVALAGGTLLRADSADPGPPRFQVVHAGAARIRALLPDERGRLWVGTSAGVLLVADGRLCDAWTVDDGLPAKEVWALTADREGRIWASTSTGLVLLDHATAPLRTLPPTAERPTAPVYACMADPKGRLWLGTDAGVTIHDPDDPDGAAPVTLAALPSALAQDTIWSVQRDQQGQMWAGTERAGLLCVDPESGALRAHLQLAAHVPVLCLEGARHLWAGLTGRGLVCLDVETRTVVHEIGAVDSGGGGAGGGGGGGLALDQVQGLQVDARGRLWAGTWTGWLACIDPARGAVVTTLRLGEPDTSRLVTDLALAPDGLLWVSTYGGGLLCVDPTADEGRAAIVRVLTTREDLPSNLLYACRVDRRGDVWVGTRRGLARYTPATGRCLVVSHSLGLPSEECNSHALFLDRRAHLWVGTTQGVGIVETGKIAAAVPPSPAYLTGLSVMGRDRTLTPDLEIDDSDYDLVFTYGAVTFTAAPQVVYRVQLVGLEPDWSAPTAQRSARYTNLRPGAYTFRVAARNWGGQWSTPAEVSFRVIRNRKAREMEEALERERIDKEVYRATADRLTELNGRLQELNRQLEETDQLKTTLIQQTQAQAALFERLARQDGLTGLLNRRALDARLAEEWSRARRHGGALTVALADLDHFKHINDTYGHQIGDQVLKTVAQLCQEVVRREDSVGRYGGEEIALLLPETTAADGREVCERLRARIAAYDWDGMAAGLRVTSSLGLAETGHSRNPHALLAAADAALYQAKAQGRNRVVAAPTEAVESAAASVAADKATADRGQNGPPARSDEGGEPETGALPALPAALPLADALDALTGLGTYRAFQRELGQAVARALQGVEALALARLDLGAFKALNRAQGRVYGDVVLSGLAAVLRSGRAEDRAFRLGGGTFAVLFPRTDAADAVAAVDRLRQQAARCLVGVTLSAGVAALGPDTPDAEALLDHAEAALEAAKQRGRDLVVPFTPGGDMGNAVPVAPAKLAAGQRLLAEGQLTICFQPIWDLGRKTILAYEALMRPAPSYGLSGPQEAFELAERLGQVPTLDALCRRAIMDAAAALPPRALLFLNVTPHTLDHGLLAGARLVEEVRVAGLAPERVVLEITERSVARPSSVVREAMRLRSLGFRLALDDTGVGNAGLEMLSQMPVDFVKVDRGVVGAAPTSAPARAVLAGILAIARETGAYVIAEGIETADLLRFVRQMGQPERPAVSVVQGAQGYLLGCPSASFPDPGLIAQQTAVIAAA